MILLCNIFIIRAESAFGGLYIDYGVVQSTEPICSSLSTLNVTFECNYALSGGSSIEMDIYGVFSPTSQNSLQVNLIHCIFRSDYSELEQAIAIKLNNAAFVTFVQCSITNILQTAAAFVVKSINSKGLFGLYDVPSIYT